MNPTVRTQNANTPSIASAATALAANPARVGFSIQNLGTNPLFVLYGAGATSSVFHVVLKGSSVQDDGTGGVATMAEGSIYTGIVTIAGTSPRYTVLEMAP
jgi:hypothetical protein